MTCDDLTGWMNIKAIILGAGKIGVKYKDFVNFNKQELMAHLDVYFLHAISPSPQVEMKFKNQTEYPVNGSDLCHCVFGKRGVTRHKEFKAFFAGVNPIYQRLQLAHTQIGKLTHCQSIRGGYHKMPSILEDISLLMNKT